MNRQGRFRKNCNCIVLYCIVGLLTWLSHSNDADAEITLDDNSAHSRKKRQGSGDECPEYVYQACGST